MWLNRSPLLNFILGQKCNIQSVMFVFIFFFTARKTMEAANNLCAINIMLMLIKCVIYIHADCYVREYKLLPGGYNIYMQNGIQTIFKTVKGIDIRDCGQMCADEKFCNVWRFGGGNCQIFHSRNDKVTAKQSTNTTIKTYYEIGEGEFESSLIFKQESFPTSSITSILASNSFISHVHIILKSLQ